jgi:hypothetical protein
MNQNTEDFATSHIDESRRRRRRRLLVPVGRNERYLYLNEIAKRLLPGLDFFLFSFLCGLVLGVAILLDNPAIYILAALIAPFMAPVVGLGFSTSVGSVRFFAQSIGSLLIGSTLVFASGALSGLISKFFVNMTNEQAQYHAVFSIPDFILLTIGAGLAIYLTVRIPKQRSLVASVALAYEIYLPIGVAGFGLTSNAPGLFPEALKVAGIHILWVILIGTIVLAFLKLRPFTFFGYLLTAVLLGGAVYTLWISSALGDAFQKQLSPFITNTPKVVVVVDTPTPTFTPTPLLTVPSKLPMEVTPTNTLMPTRTPTITITPKPTPAWAKVYMPSVDFVVVRVSPGFDSEILTSLKNEQLVQVLSDTQVLDGAIWVHVILEDGREGWMLRTLLQFATPAPAW